MKKSIKVVLPTAEAIQRLLYPYAEVVVHDIAKNKIAAIYHPFSGRKIGDPSLLLDEEMATLGDNIGPYEKMNWDGRKLKSVSSIIRDENNRAVGILCINLDISQLAHLEYLLTNFIGNDRLIPQPEELFKDDWQERINNGIHSYLNEQNLVLESLNRQQKKQLVEHLFKVGAFSGKNSATYIARIIGVSRATIYNYLSITKA